MILLGKKMLDDAFLIDVIRYDQRWLFGLAVEDRALSSDDEVVDCMFDRDLTFYKLASSYGFLLRFLIMESLGWTFNNLLELIDFFLNKFDLFCFIKLLHVPASFIGL